MHGWILVQLCDFIDHYILVYIRRVIETERFNADIGAGTDLILYINLRGSIRADENDGKPWRRSALSHDLLHALPAFVTNLPSDCNAIDDFCCHIWPSGKPICATAALRASSVYSLITRFE